eukprot:161069-Rhodomonas_salina.5
MLGGLDQAKKAARQVSRVMHALHSLRCVAVCMVIVPAGLGGQVRRDVGCLVVRAGGRAGGVSKPQSVASEAAVPCPALTQPPPLPGRGGVYGAGVDGGG